MELERRSYFDNTGAANNCQKDGALVSNILYQFQERGKFFRDEIRRKIEDKHGGLVIGMIQDPNVVVVGTIRPDPDFADKSYTHYAIYGLPSELKKFDKLVSQSRSTSP